MTTIHFVGGPKHGEEHNINHVRNPKIGIKFPKLQENLAKMTGPDDIEQIPEMKTDLYILRDRNKYDLYYYHEQMVEKMETKEIFVFGSNYGGRHGKGAALCAKRIHGAKNGIGEGIQGRAYGIPTKDAKLKTLPLSRIQKHVTTFLNYAHDHDEMIFNVTPIGTGLAGYTHQQIAPMFKGYADNVKIIKKWKEILDE